MARIFATTAGFFGVSFLLLLVKASDVIPDVSDEYVVMDGISISKEVLARQTAIQEAAPVEDEDEEEETYEEYYDEFDDDEEEDPESVKHLPTKCHICRLLVTEIEEKLKKIGNVKKIRADGRAVYFKEEIVMRQVFVDLCDTMMSYNIRRKQPFRYVYGVHTRMRDEIIQTTKNSKIHRWVFITPESEIDDPTGEIGRLKEQCHSLLVAEQETLVHWFMKAQSRDLTKWFCQQRILVDENQDCLELALPKGRRKKEKSRKDDQEEQGSHLREEL